MLLFPFFIAKAADLVQTDARLLILHRCEEIRLDDLLTREEKQAIAPLLTDVAPVRFEIHVPDEGTLHVKLRVIFVRILILKQLWREDVPGEDQIVQTGPLVHLRVSLTVLLCNALRVALRGVRVHHFGLGVRLVPGGSQKIVQILLDDWVIFTLFKRIVIQLDRSSVLLASLIGTLRVARRWNLALRL